MTATDQQRAEIEARLTAATPGPWGLASVEGMGYAVHRGEHDTIALYASRPDADLIAHAPTDLRTLLDALDAAEKLGDHGSCESVYSDLLARAESAESERDSLAVQLDEARHGYRNYKSMWRDNLEYATEIEQTLARVEAVAEKLEQPASECGEHHWAKENPKEAEDLRLKYGARPHYPDEGWSFCDGCSAAMSADQERAAAARDLRAALAGPSPTDEGGES